MTLKGKTIAGKALWAILAVMLVLTLLAGCSSRNEAALPPSEGRADSDAGINNSNKDTNGFTGSGETAEEPVPETDGSISKENSPSSISNRKIIQTGAMNIETKTFDATMKEIENRAYTLGGYIDSQEIQNKSRDEKYPERYASVVLRIPDESFRSFMDQVGTLGNVTSKTTSSKDVTLDYYDTEAHIKVLKTQEERLLELMKKENTTLEDLLKLEQELARVTYEIESNTTVLNQLSNSVDFATLTVTLTEVIDYTKVTTELPKTWWQQVGDTFNQTANSIWGFIKGLGLFVFGRILYLLIIAAIVVGTILLAKRSNRRARERLAARQAQNNAGMPVQPPRQDGNNGNPPQP